MSTSLVKTWDSNNKKLFKISFQDPLCQFHDSLLKWNIELSKIDKDISRKLFDKFKHSINIFVDVTNELHIYTEENIVLSSDTKKVIQLLQEICNDINALNLEIVNWTLFVNQGKITSGNLKTLAFKQIKQLHKKIKRDLFIQLNIWRNSQIVSDSESEYTSIPGKKQLKQVYNSIVPYTPLIYVISVLIYNDSDLLQAPISMLSFFTKIFTGLCLAAKEDSFIGVNIVRILKNLAFSVAAFFVKAIQMIYPIQILQFNNLYFNTFLEFMLVYMYFYFIKWFNFLYTTVCKIVAYSITIGATSLLKDFYVDFLNIVKLKSSNFAESFSFGVLKSLSESSTIIVDFFKVYLYNQIKSIITRQPTGSPSREFTQILADKNIISQQNKKAIDSGDISLFSLIEEKVILTLDQTSQQPFTIDFNFTDPEHLSGFNQVFQDDIEKNMKKIGIFNIMTRLQNTDDTSVNFIFDNLPSSTFSENEMVLVQTVYTFCLLYLMRAIVKKLQFN